MTENKSKASRTPAERLATLEREYRSLQDKLQLADAKGTIEDLQAQVNGAMNSVRTIRQKGYQYEPELEERTIELQEQWASLRPGLLEEIETQEARLAKSMKALDVQIRGARSSGPTQARSLERLERGLEDIEAEIHAADSTVRGMHDSYSSQLAQHRSHLSQLEWMMDEAAESSFDWLPTEAVLATVPANWIRNQGDEPRGLLFITGQRLLFEQKEEVATKKVLFVTTEKKTVQEPLLEFAVSSIQSVRSEKKGLMGHEDHLFLECDSDAPLSLLHFHLDGQDSDLWARMVKRAKSHEFDDQRIEPISEEEEQRLRSAPTECSNCGAAIRGPLLRGQRQITCAYCGTVTRI